MKKKNNKKWALVLVLLLVVSIGYAALASNLKINGTTGVKSATWDVYWDNVVINPESVATTEQNKARITDQKKTQVEYSVVLSEPGDFYEFTVDAVNNGTIDAMIEERSIVKGVYSDSEYEHAVDLPKAVSYTVTYADGTEIADKHLLAKKSGNTPTKETYKVRIEYKNDDSINPGDLDNTTNQTYYFKFSVNYVQADSTKVVRNSENVQNVPSWNLYYYLDLNGNLIESASGVPSENMMWPGFVRKDTVNNIYEICAHEDNTESCINPVGYTGEGYTDISSYESIYVNSNNSLTYGDDQIVLCQDGRVFGYYGPSACDE